MIKAISKMCNRYYLPFTLPVFTMFLAASGAAAAKLAGIEMDVSGNKGLIRSVSFPRVNLMNRMAFIALSDVVHEQRVRFAADHGVGDPLALVASVKHSPMANLLISVAIEESGGDPVAVGAAGEQGAWQVRPECWGLVPQDMHGQAAQAERIIRDLLVSTKGNKKKALAHYNGGTAPSLRSYRYAERILKRARHLQVAVNYFPPKIAPL